VRVAYNPWMYHLGHDAISRTIATFALRITIFTSFPIKSRNQ